jgi:hypothetical protein
MDSGKTISLRHTVATLAYRAAKVLSDAPAEFADFGECTRTPGQILAHLCELIDWTITLINGQEAWHESPPLGWEEGNARFFAALEALDQRLRSEAPLNCPAERLFQGPIADALTHVGQLAMLRRLADCPIRGENYYQAEIAAGRVGPHQAAPKKEFE